VLADSEPDASDATRPTEGTTMSMLKNIAALIDSAKTLRQIAEEQENLELKSRIVDEISKLQEIREQVHAGGAQTAPPGLTNAGAGEDPAPGLLDNQSHAVRLEPPKDSDTYSIAANEETDKATDESSDTDVDIPIATGAQDTEELTEEQRFMLAESRIAELEPLHQSILRKMNDVLTDDQKRTKSVASKAGRKAGLAGKELQKSVMTALLLSEEQQQQMVEARKELQRVRMAIAKQVEGLLDKGQLDEVLKGGTPTSKN
jgi:hypothetical protein